MNVNRQILATKLYLPPPTITLVARPRLFDRLAMTLRRPVTTVIAPAGFGKTMLVSTWAAGVAAEGVAAVAWLTLDPSDNEPSSFWSAVIAALQRIDPVLGAEVLPLLRTLTTSPPEHLLTVLLNQLVEYTAAPIVLVLDDYHAISAPAIHTALTFFVDHLPPHVHLVLTSRNDPPLPLARLRARGQLTELRVADLRFTLEEAASFLNDAMGLSLAADLIDALETRTEGWIAGLHLAGLSMQDRTDRASFVRAFTGSHHYILDYLVEEVLQRQPAAIRDFLLQTAILDRLCVSLCNAVTESAEAATALATVARANLFLLPLDDERRWFRYHHLFVEMLRARLAQEQPTLIPRLHQRASLWYAQHAAGETDMRGEAIRHALAAGDGERAVQLIDEVADLLWERNELTTICAWLMSLPTAVLHRHPRQAIRLAQILLANGLLADVPPLLDATTVALARVALPDDEKAALHARVLVVRSHLARIAEQFEEAITLAEEALTVLPASARASRALAALGLAMAHHMQGALPTADRIYCDAIALCEAVGDRFVEITTRCLHGRLLQERGNLIAAEAAFRQALERATQGTQRLPIAGWALIGLGNVAYMRNDLLATADLLEQGLDLARRGGVHHALYDGLRGLVRLRLAQGDLAAAREAATQFTQETQTSQIPQFIRWAGASQALVDLRSGELAAALRWAQTLQPRPSALFFTDKTAFAIFVRVLLAHGQIADARRWIAAQRTQAAAFDHIETQIDLCLLDTVALLAMGETTAAVASLDVALHLAAPSGIVRLFIIAGEPIRAFLAQRTQNDPLQPFVQHLLATFDNAGFATAPPQLLTHPMPDPVSANGYPASDSAIQNPKPVLSIANVSKIQNLIDPLSERELEVLRLMAVGLSNQEIANRLIISVPTVKKHGSNIFGKLQATNRTEAVALARHLRLLA